MKKLRPFYFFAIVFFIICFSISHASDSKIDINTASVKELIKLPGVGKVLAHGIVKYRENVGAFDEIKDLMKVKGLGKKKFKKIQDLITTGQAVIDHTKSKKAKK